MPIHTGRFQTEKELGTSAKAKWSRDSTDVTNCVLCSLGSRSRSATTFDFALTDFG